MPRIDSIKDGLGPLDTGLFVSLSVPWILISNPVSFVKVDYQSADDKHFDSVPLFFGAAGKAASTLFSLSLLGCAIGFASIGLNTLETHFTGRSYY